MKILLIKVAILFFTVPLSVLLAWAGWTAIQHGSSAAFQLGITLIVVAIGHWFIWLKAFINLKE